MIWPSTGHQHEGHQVDTYDEEDLEDGEEELKLSVDADKEDVARKNQQTVDSNEDGVADRCPGPVVCDDRSGDDLCGYAHDCTVDLVPADGEAHGGTEEVLSVANDTAAQGDEGAHFGDGEDGCEDQDTNERVPEESSQRTAGEDGMAATEEQTGSDGA